MTRASHCWNRGWRYPGCAAAGRQSGDEFEDRAEALGRGLGDAEEVREWAAELAIDEEHTIPVLGVGLGTVAGCGGGVYGYLIGLVLLRIGVVVARGMLVLEAGVEEALELGVDIGFVADTDDAEKAFEVGGSFDGELVGEDVTHLVGDDRGDFVFAVGVGDELACDVDMAAGEREGIDLRGVKEQDAELNIGGRKRGQEPFGDACEVLVLDGVLNGLVVTLNHVGHGIAEPLFLLLGKDIWLSGLEDGGRRGAGGWNGLRCGDVGYERQEYSKEKSGPGSNHNM